MHRPGDWTPVSVLGAVIVLLGLISITFGVQSEDSPKLLRLEKYANLLQGSGFVVIVIGILVCIVSDKIYAL